MQIKKIILAKKNLHILAGIIQLAAVILAAVQLFVVSTLITSEARIMWLSAQNLLGGLIVADLGLSQVSQRFAGYFFSGNKNKYSLKYLFKKSRKYYLLQIAAIFIIIIIQFNLGIEDYVNYQTHLIIILIGFITLHKNRLGGILNNLRNPNLTRLIDVLSTLLRIALMVVFRTNIQVVLLGWCILLLCQSAFYFWVILPYLRQANVDMTMDLFDKNVFRTALLNLGGFYISYLGGILILKFTDAHLVDSYLLTHRILLLIFGVSQSFVYVSVPFYSQYFIKDDYANLKYLFRRSIVYSVMSYGFGVVLVYFLWDFLPIEVRLLEFNYFVILALTYLLEIIHINLVTVTLAKPWQPYLKSVILMMVLFTAGYWIALVKLSFLLFMLVPLVVQIVASYPFSVYFYIRDSRWNVFRKNI